MAVTSLRVTLSGATQVSATSILARWVTFINNAAAKMNISDSAVATDQGIPLAQTGGNFFLPPTSDISQVHDLSQWYAKGTDTQVLDVVYDKVGS